MPAPAKVFAALAAALALAIIVAGLVVIGSPGEVRMRRFDETRAENLSTLSNAISSYRQTHESLPQKLDDLTSAVGPYVLYSLKDPIGQAYEYRAEDAYSYQLCATFDRATDRPEPGYGETMFAKHGKGRQCFSLQARPRVQR